MLLKAAAWDWERRGAKTHQGFRAGHNWRDGTRRRSLPMPALKWRPGLYLGRYWGSGKCFKAAFRPRVQFMRVRWKGRCRSRADSARNVKMVQASQNDLGESPAPTTPFVSQCEACSMDC